MITSLEDFEAFPWPNADDLNYHSLQKVEDLLPEGMGVIVFAGAIFSSLMLMMGIEEGLIGMMTGTELFRRLLEQVGEFQVSVVEKLMTFPAIDAIWINDDMGFKSRTLVNPDLFRKYTFPYYREIKEIVQVHDKPLLLHSDGNITLILRDLVDIGFNAIHPVEPEAMDIVETREIVGSNVCLIGNLSLGYPLGTGTPEDVRVETLRLIQTMAPDGGYCLSSGNSIPDYVSYENWLAMRNTALETGYYPFKGQSDGGNLTGRTDRFSRLTAAEQFWVRAGSVRCSPADVTDLLILDDWLRDSLSLADAQSLLDILDDRYGRSATLVATQFPIAVWHSRIPDPTVADAILDRLVHNAHRLELLGDSQRKIRAEAIMASS